MQCSHVNLNKKLPMGKRKRGRPRKIRNREAPLGKRKRERPGKISLGQAEEREGESGQLTPTTVDSITHHQRTDPTSTPPEFLSELVHHPPVPSRYPTQHGEIKSANEITSDSSDLTPAKWVLAETIDSLSPDNEDIPNLEKFTSKLNVQNQVSNTLVASSTSSSQDLRTTRHTSTPWLARDFSVVTKKKWLAKKGKIIEDNGSVSAASEDQSIPTSNGLLNNKKFASELLHQSWGLEKIQAAAPPSAQHDVVLNNDLSNSKANVEPKGEPIQSLSLNLTEMVAMLNDNASDAAEVWSALDPALVTVNGYTVKEEFASLLRDIFSKYGDIAKASSLRTMRSRSSFLEIVCVVFQMLKRAKFTEITPTELKCMLDLIADVEFARVEIGWLHKRLNDIYEANVLFKSSSFLKEAKTSINEAFKQTEKEVEGYKAEMLKLKEKMLILQEKISLAEEKMATMKAESEKINEAALDTKTKVKCFYERSLVDGLL